ncbi:alpha-N-acetylgalactosaminidase [Trichonephila inaurata madagascariensis]|uniref:Alpha-galactosidase n=1 Tax=Trichonephila inaurata madagascariensis TaxID=2747483 RepID=A0A8X6X3S5_9ARAC|nr:alpha-N-acetylgalactosaminidase [Trichonephila inaurata madagascariensis]
MGWLSWERFTCNTDCKNDPDNCISEKLYKDMADRLVTDGYKDLGLADYKPSKGLKLGIYQDIGNKTCAGFPGSYGHFEIDAATFAEWEVDMLKVDGCYADPKQMDDLYPVFSSAIRGKVILSIVDYYITNQEEFVAAAGPGHWNDPDMILAGNLELSYDEAKAQFMLWAGMASPLLVSNELHDIRKEFSDLL